MLYKGQAALMVPVPSLNKNLKATKTCRNVSQAALFSRSVMPLMTSSFGQFFMRMCMSSLGSNALVAPILAQFISQAAQTTYAKLRASIPTSQLSDQDLKMFVAHEVSVGNASLDALFSDVFNALYSGNAPLQSGYERNPALHAIMQALAKSPGFDSLQRGTKGDAAKAAFVATFMLKSLLRPSGGKGSAGVSSQAMEGIGEMLAEKMASTASKQKSKPKKSSKQQQPSPSSDSDEDEDANEGSEERDATSFGGDEGEDSEGVGQQEQQEQQEQQDGEGDAQQEQSKPEANEQQDSESEQQSKQAAEKLANAFANAMHAAASSARNIIGSFEGDSERTQNAREQLDGLDVDGTLGAGGKEAGTQKGTNEDNPTSAEQAMRVFNKLFDYAESKKGNVALYSSLSNVFSLVGRFNGWLGAAESSSRHGDGEMTDIIPGNQLHNVIPSDYLKFVVPDLRPQFIQRMAEEQLLTFERKGFGEFGNGPLIALVDCSGSMDGTFTSQDVGDGRGTIRCSYYEMACAFALALAQYAAHNQRDYIIVPFDTEVKFDRCVVNIATHRPKDRKALLAQVKRLCSTSCNGGTAFLESLKDFHEKLMASPYSDAFIQGGLMNSADVIFFTDGQGDTKPVTRRYPDGSTMDIIDRTDLRHGLQAFSDNRAIMLDPAAGFIQVERRGYYGPGAKPVTARELQSMTVEKLKDMFIWKINDFAGRDTTANSDDDDDVSKPSMRFLGGYEVYDMLNMAYAQEIRSKFGRGTRFYSLTLTSQTCGAYSAGAKVSSYTLNSFRHSDEDESPTISEASFNRKSGQAVGGYIVNAKSQAGIRRAAVMNAYMQTARRHMPDFTLNDTVCAFNSIAHNITLFDHNAVIFANRFGECMRMFFEQVIAEGFYGEHQEE